ncbi:MAG: hypothetical protein ACOY3J_11650 [Bacillota bacterium]
MPSLKMSDLIPDNIMFYPEAMEDFYCLDKGRQIMVIKVLQKISLAPSKLGKPLENHPNRPLAGFRSTYVDNKSIRIIWTVKNSGIVEIAVIAGIAERNDLLAYTLVASRRHDIYKFIEELLEKR